MILAEVVTWCCNIWFATVFGSAGSARPSYDHNLYFFTTNQICRIVAITRLVTHQVLTIITPISTPPATGWWDDAIACPEMHILQRRTGWPVCFFFTPCWPPWLKVIVLCLGLLPAAVVSQIFLLARLDSDSLLFDSGFDQIHQKKAAKSHATTKTKNKGARLSTAQHQEEYASHKPGRPNIWSHKTRCSINRNGPRVHNVRT